MYGLVTQESYLLSLLRRRKRKKCLKNVGTDIIRIVLLHVKFITETVDPVGMYIEEKMCFW